MGKVEIRTKKIFLAVGIAYVAVFWPAPACKGRTFVSSALWTEGTLISADMQYRTAGGVKHEEQREEKSMQACAHSACSIQATETNKVQG